MSDLVSSQNPDDQILASVLAKTVAPAAQAPEPVNHSSASDWSLPGFHGKSRITTLFGELPIEALRRRDEVKLHSGRYVRVEWIDRIQLDEGFLSSFPDAQPVLIRAGALAAGKPKVDILISPEQMIGLTNLMPTSRYDSARDMLTRPGVMRRSATNVTYYLFHCGEAASVSVEGLWCSTSP